MHDGGLEIVMIFMMMKLRNRIIANTNLVWQEVCSHQYIRMSDDTFLYFGYGSNLSEARIHINNPSAEFCCTAKLVDYRLVFGRKEDWMSTRWKGGVASIEETPGEEVWGVVWKIHKDHMPNLDRQEGGYKVIYVNVRTPKGELLNCRTYQMDGVIEIPTSPQYLDVIMTGASSVGLPDDYRKFLSEVKHNGYDGPLQVMSQLEAMTTTTNETFMYFAYGSNLSKARIHINNPSAEFYAVAKLKDYKLVFGCQDNWSSNRWHGGVASIEEAPGHDVWGVIWKIHQQDMANLDKQEGKLYRVIHVNVSLPDGEMMINCRTYQMKHIAYRQPSPQYKSVIEAGATKARLPGDYMNLLHGIEDNGYDGPSILDDIGLDNLCFDVKQEVGYRPIEICVKTAEDKPHTCRTYELIGKIDLPPSPQYMEVISTGAVQGGLPIDYVDLLSKIEHNGYDGPMDIMADD
ncbi:uncharacterized protein [Amphiura filiformis]|uniref:uncharacterized protein n=1 Tax=Amphiura filiformis TaxID=82378 RepID=UPI003B20BD91